MSDERYSKDIKNVERKINWGNFDANVRFLERTGLLKEGIRILQEVKRVLKPKGYYLLQTPNEWTNLPFEQFGILGLIALRIFNPDNFPYFLRTNFYLEGKKI